MSQRIVQVDAFADRPFAGNPAAVCVLAEPADEAWMQAVANEMNLAETAFLHRLGDDFSLRWFTPTVEVDLCGHATLASAHVLWEEGHLPRDETARFHTKSGILTATSRGDRIELDFPAEPPSECDPPAGISEAIGVEPTWFGRNRMDKFLAVASAGEVRSLRPDFARIAALGGRGLIVTARSDDPKYDFISRFFAPNSGVPEDPVTGSAHCALGPYWGDRLGKTDVIGYQASPRGGEVGVSVRGDRVILSGRAITILRGDLDERARPTPAGDRGR